MNENRSLGAPDRFWGVLIALWALLIGLWRLLIAPRKSLIPFWKPLTGGPQISKMAEKPHPGFGQIFEKKMVSGHHLDISGDLPAKFLASEAFPGADPHMGPPGPRKKIQFET